MNAKTLKAPGRCSQPNHRPTQPGKSIVNQPVPVPDEKKRFVIAMTADLGSELAIAAFDERNAKVNRMLGIT